MRGEMPVCRRYRYNSARVERTSSLFLKIYGINEINGEVPTDGDYVRCNCRIPRITHP